MGSKNQVMCPPLIITVLSGWLIKSRYNKKVVKLFVCCLALVSVLLEIMPLLLFHSLYVMFVLAIYMDRNLL